MKRFVGVLLIFVLLLTGCGQAVLTWQEQYDLGVRYLSEGNYEEAILAFTAAIEIDPMQAEPYVQLAEIYTELGDDEKLRAILDDALMQFGEEEFEKLFPDAAPESNLPEKENEPENNPPEKLTWREFLEAKDLVKSFSATRTYTLNLEDYTSEIEEYQWPQGILAYQCDDIDEANELVAFEISGTDILLSLYAHENEEIMLKDSVIVWQNFFNELVDVDEMQLFSKEHNGTRYYFCDRSTRGEYLCNGVGYAVIGFTVQDGKILKCLDEEIQGSMFFGVDMDQYDTSLANCGLASMWIREDYWLDTTVAARSNVTMLSTLKQICGNPSENTNMDISVWTSASEEIE